MTLKVYTDGACSGNPGPGGWAAIIVKEDGSELEISGFCEYTTNNKMELLAVVESLRLARKLECSEVRIISDSSYVINPIQKHWLLSWVRNDWKASRGEQIKNMKLWKKYLFYASGIKIITHKVKGHSGHEYNERADKLARLEIRKNK